MDAKEVKLLPQWTETKSPITKEFVELLCNVIYEVAKAKVLSDEYYNSRQVEKQRCVSMELNPMTGLVILKDNFGNEVKGILI